MESLLQIKAQPSILSLFPKDVEFVAHSYIFDDRIEALIHYEDPNGEVPLIEIPMQLRRAPAKRKAAFIAGRVCAAHAVAQLKGEPQVPKVGDAGQPVWPGDIVGAITHTDDYAAVIVANQREYRGLGIDAEILLDLGEANSLAHLILTPDEHRIKYSGFDFARFVTIAFSAKESFYKAIYPLVGHFIDFQDVEILQVGASSLQLVLRTEVTGDIGLNKPVAVGYAQYEQRILTFTQLLD